MATRSTNPGVTRGRSRQDSDGCAGTCEPGADRVRRRYRGGGHFGMRSFWPTLMRSGLVSTSLLASKIFMYWLALP